MMKQHHSFLLRSILMLFDNSASHSGLEIGLASRPKPNVTQTQTDPTIY